MSITELRNQVLQFLSTSQSFQAIEVSQREKLIKDLEQADETQLSEVLVIMQEEEERYKRAQQARLSTAQNQIALAEQLHQQIKESDKALLHAKEDDDKLESAKQLADMESQLKPTQDVSKSKAPRKKFLGIF